MAIVVIPTLALMAGIYQLSSSGGAQSDRFTAYRQAAEQRIPIYGYNPMTSEPVLETVLALIALEAESLVESAANDAAASIGSRLNTAIHLTVATPGMWTDRLATEVDHHLMSSQTTGVLLWRDGPVTTEHITRETTAQIVRLAAALDRGGSPATLHEAVQQEGAALALAGGKGALDDRAAEILATKVADPGLSTMVAFLYGDEAAATMGYSPLGLGERVGYEHAVALQRSADFTSISFRHPA